MLKFKSAFVTGATGLLGNNLVRALVARGVRVRALVRDPAKARYQLHGLPVEIIPGDMTNVAGFAAALEGMDVLFHTAASFRNAYSGGDHWSEMKSVNVDGTTALLQAARGVGICNVVHTSSTAVLWGARGTNIDETMLRDPQSADDYFRSKILAERAVLNFLQSHTDMRVVLVLPGWMHGPGDAGPTSAGQMTLNYVRKALPGVPPGEFAFVDARDVAEGLIAAMERGKSGERYLIAGRAMSVLDVFAALERVTGIAAPRRRIPYALLLIAALMSEAKYRLTGKPVLLSWAGVRLLAKERGRRAFDSSKAQRELGVRFRAVEETLKDEIAWYRAQGWLPPAQ